MSFIITLLTDQSYCYQTSLTISSQYPHLHSLVFLPDKE